MTRIQSSLNLEAPAPQIFWGPFNPKVNGKGKEKEKMKEEEEEVDQEREEEMEGKET